MDKESVCLPSVARTWDGDDSASRVGGDNVLREMSFKAYWK